MSVAVTTRGFSNLRQDANTAEQLLTQATVRERGIKRLFTVPLPGDARGTEGTTLIAPGITTADGLVHDVMIHGTMSNYVTAHDANDGTPLWTERVGDPIIGTQAIDYWAINDHWGILGTGVIDLAAQAYGCIAWSSPDGTAANAAFYFHWLSLVDGSPLAPALPLDGCFYTPPGGLPVQRFDSAARKQRCALLLTVVGNVKTVFACFGSVGESLASNRGWVIAIDVSDGNVAVAATWSSTARYSGAGIWMGAGGPAAVGNTLYFITGNGAFDPPTDLGESFVTLKYTPKTLTAADWWSPFSDSGRDGQDPTHPVIADDTPGLTNASNMNAWTDMDLGSGGIGLNTELGYAIGAGKDGIGYVLPLAAFGKTKPGDFADSTAGNYARCAWVGWFTFFPGWDVSPTPTQVLDLNQLFDGYTHHQHSTPVQFKSQKNGWTVFCFGENSVLRAWHMNNDGTLAFLASGDEVASMNVPPPGGMPGGMMALSCNGTTSGTAVLWASIPYENANSTIGPGHLVAYDAENFVRRPDGSMQIQKLWDSADWGLNYTFSKFMAPCPANGKVYLPDYAGNVMVFGLA